MDGTETAARPGRKLTWLGVIAIVLGMMAMIAPGLTGTSVAALVGVFVVWAGIAHLVWAFQAGSLGRAALVFATGVLTVLAGLALVANPLFASGVLALVLAGYFVLDGLFEIGASFRLRPGSGWMWMLFAGIVSILLGVMIWQQFPLSGVYAIGVLLGIKLFSVGLVMVTAGESVQALSREARPA
jgi:uncharacterized membrane protein HdeD (DUF308 family)